MPIVTQPLVPILWDEPRVRLALDAVNGKVAAAFGQQPYSLTFELVTIIDRHEWLDPEKGVIRYREVFGADRLEARACLAGHVQGLVPYRGA